MGDIVRACWIKPVARRSPSQTCGHTVLAFSMPEAANKALAHGLFICQKKVYAKKCKKEPIHCLKCHGWGHLAHDCAAPHDICGTCAQHHRTSTCTNAAHPHCVSCGIAGHASWDRNCPVFQRKCAEMNNRLEENNMPYYPTSEVWTQARESPRTVYITPSPLMHTAAGPRPNGSYTQTTLAWNTASATRRGPPPSSMPPYQDKGPARYGSND